MNKWIITAESGSDISFAEARELGVEIIPMHVTMGDKTYDDGTFSPDRVCQYYNETKQVPKTSGCTPYDFSVFFARVHAEHPQAHIIHLAYSAATTVSYSSACMQAEGKDYITVVDTKHVSAGQRAVVLHALQLLQETPDITPEELVRRITAFSKRTRMCFLPENLAYLRAGGRCSNAAYLGGTLLNLHPCIEVVDGKLLATKKYHGSFLRVIPKLVVEYAEKNHLDKKQIWMIYTPGLEDRIKALAEKTAKDYGFGTVSWVASGNVITSHGGQGAMGIVGIEQAD